MNDFLPAQAKRRFQRQARIVEPTLVEVVGHSVWFVGPNDLRQRVRLGAETQFAGVQRGFGVLARRDVDDVFDRFVFAEG